MDAIVVATNWLPSRSPRAVMNERLFGALAWQGDAFVADEQLGARDDRQSSSGLTVHRVPLHGVRLLARVLNRLRLSWLLDMPDRYLLWSLETALRVHRRLQRRQADVLVTVSKYDSSHVAGLLIKRLHPELRWVTVFSDPWLELERFGYIHYTRMTRPVNARLEAAVLAACDAACFTCEETRTLFTRRYPDLAPRSHIVSQCYDPELFMGSAARTPIEPRKLVVRYLGDLYSRRSPITLLRAINQVEKRVPAAASSWRFEIVGKFACDDALDCQRELEQTRSVVFVKPVGYRDSLALMAEADVLLVIDAPADASPFLPSKLVEYLGANRPIVALTPAQGAAANLVRRAGGLVADVSDGRAIEAILERVLEAWGAGRLGDLQPDPAVRAEYSRGVVAERFDGIVRATIR